MIMLRDVTVIMLRDITVARESRGDGKHVRETPVCLRGRRDAAGATNHICTTDV